MKAIMADKKKALTSTKTLAERIADIGHVCVPGMRLNVCNEKFIPGRGTIELLGYIYASVPGLMVTTVDEATQISTVSVTSHKPPCLFPKTGDIITGRVTVVNPRMVYCMIICVNEDVLTRPCKGIIKKEDIRNIDKDQTDPYKCFKTGDIILAKVAEISVTVMPPELNYKGFYHLLADTRQITLPNKEVHNYLLSTAENELGVVIAKAEGSPLGVNMVPISWSEMLCPKTRIREKRKVARVLPESLDHVMHLVKENGEMILDEPKDNEK